MSDLYTNAAQQRILSLAERMAAHAVDGVSNTELARAIRTSASNITRDLENLKTAGWAMRLDTGLWVPTTKPVQISVQVSAALQRAQEHLDEARQRFTRVR